MAGDLFAYRDLGRSLSGASSVRCRRGRCLGASALGSRSEALHAAAVTPLVGREEELHTLLRAWQQAKSGEGRLVLAVR